MADKNVEKIAECLEKIRYCYEQWLGTQGVFINYDNLKTKKTKGGNK